MRNIDWMANKQLNVNSTIISINRQNILKEIRIL